MLRRRDPAKSVSTFRTPGAEACGARPFTTNPAASSGRSRTTWFVPGRLRAQRRGREEIRRTLIESALRHGRAGTPVHGTGAESLGLQAGEQVVHARYGEGIVLEVSGTGTEAEATIRFPGAGKSASAST